VLQQLLIWKVAVEPLTEVKAKSLPPRLVAGITAVTGSEKVMVTTLLFTTIEENAGGVTSAGGVWSWAEQLAVEPVMFPKQFQ